MRPQRKSTRTLPKPPRGNFAIAALPDLYDLALGYASSALQRAFAGRVDYDCVLWDEAVRDLEVHFGVSAAGILSEPALLTLEDRTRRLLEEIRPVDPFRRVWAADSVLARCCYLVCRLAKPRVVVETGVAYGVSSAFMLRAMEMNGTGTLHSIDLAPPTRGIGEFRGIAVPGDLRHAWTLYPGSSRRRLSPLLEGLGGVDVFLHDSLHTGQNMLREFSEVWPHLARGGVILADDVERNGAFGELSGRNPKLHRVVSDRETTPLHGPKSPITFGVSIK